MVDGAGSVAAQLMLSMAPRVSEDSAAQMGNEARIIFKGSGGEASMVMFRAISREIRQLMGTMVR